MREELDKVKRGSSVVNLDGEGGTSLSMIHMIFQFYLQSGEYPFFIKRVKNIAQSKMACEGDKLRMQNQYAKPFRSSSKKNLSNMSQINRSDNSLNQPFSNVAQRNRRDEMYIDTDGSVSPVLNAQEDEILS